MSLPPSVLKVKRLTTREDAKENIGQSGSSAFLLGDGLDLLGMVIVNRVVGCIARFLGLFTASGEFMVKRYAASFYRVFFSPHSTLWLTTHPVLKLAQIIMHHSHTQQHLGSHQAFTSESSLIGEPFSTSTRPAFPSTSCSFSTRRSNIPGFNTARTPIAMSIGAASNPMT